MDASSEPMSSDDGMRNCKTWAATLSSSTDKASAPMASRQGGDINIKHHEEVNASLPSDFFADALVADALSADAALTMLEKNADKNKEAELENSSYEVVEGESSLPAASWVYVMPEDDDNDEERPPTPTAEPHMLDLEVRTMHPSSTMMQ
eukprot:4555260-Pyramimonas_sp.AAC.1